MVGTLWSGLCFLDGLAFHTLQTAMHAFADFRSLKIFVPIGGKQWLPLLYENSLVERSLPCT
jgi:hypothetical protein